MTLSNDDPNDVTRSHVQLVKDTVIGHYRIIEKIGAGGMGEVYLAEDTELNRKVALKFLPPDLCRDADCRARFKRETQAAAKLNHPHIIMIFDVGEFTGRPFFAMEYIDGVSLDEYIRNKKLSWSEIINLSTQIAEGLGEAHHAGIIHRDIKPSNILVDNKGRAKILDFGLAAIKGEKRLTKTGSTVGTLYYMSPEQTRGETLDERSDIFSFGAVLYEMITGQIPFRGEHEPAILYAIAYEEPEPIARYKSGIPEGLQQIVDRALEKNLETRYQTASGMLADLRRLVSSESIVIPKKRVPRLAWVAGIVLLTAIVWGGLQFKSWLSPSTVPMKSIAVVDFDNVGSKDDAYLASGLAEDLSIKLRQMAGVQVASSADIRRLSKENLLPREIASRLKVQYALGGSLLRQDSLVRVNVELIDRETGKVVWSDQINKQYKEIFQFLDEVSLRIAQALEIRLTPVEKTAMAVKPTENTGAYDHYLKGRHYYYNVTFRDNELAEDEFARALQLDPDYPLALAGMADVFVQRYKESFDNDEFWLDSAHVLIERALRLEDDLAEAYESRAELYLQEDNITGALEAAKQAHVLEPNWDEPYIHLGDIYRERGMRDLALALYDSALSIRMSVDALCGKGDIYKIRGQVDSVRTAYQTAADLNPNHDRPLVALADFYEGMGNSQEMEKYERRAIEARPDQAYNYALLSTTLYLRGQVTEAEKLLKGYVDRYPYSWEGYYRLAVFYYEYRGIPDGIAVLQEAVRRNPDRIWPYLLLAYSSALRLSPRTESNRPSSGTETSVDAVKRALALRPTSGRVLAWAGITYLFSGFTDKAMECYDKAMKARPGSSYLMSWISISWNDVGESEKSVDYGLRAIAISPGNSDYYSNWLRDNLMRLNMADKWLEIVERGAEQYGDDPFFIRALGEEKRAEGDYGASVALIRQALKIKSLEPWLIDLAASLWMSGDAQNAIETFKKAPNEELSTVGIVDILKSERKFDEIDKYLASIKTYTPGQGSGLERWAISCGAYYMSMRRFDDALRVYSEYRASGKERNSEHNSLLIATCLRQQGALGRARETLEGLFKAPGRYYQPLALAEIAKLDAIELESLQSSIERAKQAVGDAQTPWNLATKPLLLSLLRFQFANRQVAEVDNTLPNLGFYSWDPAVSYRKAQLAEAIGSDSAEAYLGRSVTELTRWSHGEAFSEMEEIVIGEACSYCAIALARAGKPDDAREQVRRAINFEPEREDIAYNAACAYSLIGDTALALQWLQTAVDRGHLELWWAKVDPDLDPLRNLPRFKTIVTDWDNRIKAIVAGSGKS